MGAALFALAGYHAAVREVLGLVAAGFAVSSLDGLAIDASFAGRAIWRRVAIRTRWPAARADRMDGPCAPFAIIVPAWDEAAVIGPMLRALLAALDYEDYRVFVGVYPNDTATIAAVQTVDDPRLAVVVCGAPGPTTKADCLNHLWRAVVADEAGIR